MANILKHKTNHTQKKYQQMNHTEPKNNITDDIHSSEHTMGHEVCQQIQRQNMTWLEKETGQRRRPSPYHMHDLNNLIQLNMKVLHHATLRWVILFHLKRKWHKTFGNPIDSTNQRYHRTGDPSMKKRKKGAAKGVASSTWPINLSSGFLVPTMVREYYWTKFCLLLININNFSGRDFVQ